MKSSETKSELKRHLSFRDVYFLSFGGQSPLLSLLTYGAVAVSLGGLFSPVIMILAALLVLINGFVVLRLSKRFTTTGGYYSYAVQTLSDRVGFETGWMYIFYSLLFGLAYLIGAVFVINYILGLPIFLILFAMLAPAILFLVIGIQPSARYAVYSGILEILIIVAMFVVTLLITKGSFYLPSFSGQTNNGGNFALAILFAMGIPTGYGAIAPISGEVKNPEKVVGKAAISVIMTGGILSALFIYGIINLLSFKGLPLPIPGSGLPILSIIGNDFGNLGKYFIVAMAIGAINDGILAILSFASAASRTIFRMGFDHTLPSIFAYKRRDQPLISNLAVSGCMVVIPTIMIFYFKPEVAFVILGTISVLGGLLIHITADFSLLRVGVRRARRFLIRGVTGFYNKLLVFKEIVLALVAAVMTVAELLYSAYSTNIIYSTIFLMWIVIGYLLIDVKDIVFRTPYEELKSTKEDRVAVERMKSLTAIKIRSVLPDVVINADDTIETAINRCQKLDSPAAVVINSQSIPLGTFVTRDAFLLSEYEISRMKVREGIMERVVNVKADQPLSDLLRLFRETGMPILCIVDENGKFAGTVREREIILQLASIRQESTEVAHPA